MSASAVRMALGVLAGLSLAARGGEPFGHAPARTTGPRYADGWLPIVRVSYATGGTTYAQEAFAAARGALADYGTVFVRFTARDKAGVVAARPEGGQRGALKAGP